MKCSKFQSTHSLRSATAHLTLYPAEWYVSIHVIFINEGWKGVNLG
nr:MAG TPA: hypothetical protein [Caudoviricetes sp.]